MNTKDDWALGTSWLSFDLILLKCTMIRAWNQHSLRAVYSSNIAHFAAECYNPAELFRIECTHDVIFDRASMLCFENFR